MGTTTLVILFIILIALILLAAFFSSSETSMMAINRYRLRHLTRANNHTAIRVSKLLERSDRLLGVILIGSTFANILASSIATLIAVHIWGDAGIVIVTLLLTFIMLLFGEITPKTLAVAYPQRIAFLISYPLMILLKLLYPVVWLSNLIVNSTLKIFGVRTKAEAIEHLTSEELSTLVREAGNKIPDTHQDMLLAILELERVTVDDIMINRNDIVGIDLDDEWSVIQNKITRTQHTKIPIYQNDINNLKGMLHIRIALKLLSKGELTKVNIEKAMTEPYFIPEGVPLHIQLLNFRAIKTRIAFIVDEYGDIQGLVTLEDILEEIVGKYTTDIPAIHKEIKKLADGSYLIDAAISIRELNKQLNTNFDTSGPKTLGGLIIEELEMIPQAGVCLKILDYPVEIISVKNNRIHKVKILNRIDQRQS